MPLAEVITPATAPVTSARRVAFQGGDERKHRSVANYVWSDGTPMKWDPQTCSGPSDRARRANGEFACGTTEHPDWNMGDWADQSGTAFVDPGFQFYEDPDPQASPEAMGFVTFGQVDEDPYPLPALYLGSCGVVFGGGDVQVPASPLTNAAGQLVIPTTCS